MREDTRLSRDVPSESGETFARQYESLLDEGMCLAQEFAQAEKNRRRGLSKALDRLFARRVAILRQLHRFATLDDKMPGLRAIEQRTNEEAASWNAERIANAFNLEGDRPAHMKMAESSEAHRRLFGIESDGPVLKTTEMDEFKRVRRAVLEGIGCGFVFGEGRARYTNSVSLLKDNVVVHLTHDALPTKGLPNAERISGITIFGYVDGQARGHVVSYQRGRWTERIKDPRIQRTIDEIAAAVG